MSIFLRLVFCLLVVTMITSCASIGAFLLPKDREKFNGAMITSEEQQLLLNIVRMRFEDRPYFVSVDSITTSRTATLSSGANISASPTTSNSGSSSSGTTSSYSLATSYAISPSASYSDSPTISFTPLQGEKFTSQMLAPISIEYLYLLLESGWSADRLFRIAIHHLYIHENVSTVSMRSPPDFTNFLEILELLTELRKVNIIYYKLGEITEISVPGPQVATADNAVSLLPSAPSTTMTTNHPRHVSSTKERSVKSRHMVSIDPITSIDIVIDKKYIHSQRIQKLYKLLGTMGSPRIIHLVDDRALGLGLKSRHNNIFVFQQRTFLSALYYLRNAVEYTDEAVQQGLIEVVRYPNGQYYNLTDITKGILHVYISNTKPLCNVSTMVYHRNHWFYIADNDIVSKKTFALLEQLFNLQSGDPASQSPVLTLPVK